MPGHDGDVGPGMRCTQGQLYLICSAIPMMATTQMPVTNSVNRSRFFSTTGFQLRVTHACSSDEPYERQAMSELVRVTAAPRSLMSDKQ